MDFISRLKQLIQMGAGQNGVSQDNLTNYRGVVSGQIPQERAEVYQNPDPSMRIGSGMPSGQFESLPINMTPEQMAAKGNQNMQRGFDSYGNRVFPGRTLTPDMVRQNMQNSMNMQNQATSQRDNLINAVKFLMQQGGYKRDRYVHK